MVETYFAIRVYVLYAMLAVLGVCGIIIAVLLLIGNKKRR